MNPHLDARVTLCDPNDSPRCSCVVSRVPESEGLQRNVVVNPTLVINAVRNGLMHSQGAMDMPLTAAKMILLLEEPLTKPLGSMQSVSCAARVREAGASSSWWSDDLTPTRPRLVLKSRQAEAFGVPDREACLRREGQSPVLSLGDADTQPGRLRAVACVGQRGARVVAPAAVSRTNPAWARSESTETLHAHKVARVQLRAEWRHVGSSRDARRNAAARLQLRAGNGGRSMMHAEPTMTRGRARAPHATQSPWSGEGARSRRMNKLGVPKLHGIGPHAVLASVVAMAAFVFVLAFALTSSLLVASDAPAPSAAANR